jgi:hypothetical protein
LIKNLEKILNENYFSNMSKIKNGEKISKSKLCLKLSQEILYNSLAQAILKLFTRTPNKILKLFWLTCILVSIGFASYTIIQSILDYLSFDVVTKSRTVFERPTLFPKVTICMLSPFTTKYAYDFLKDNIDSPYNFLRNESLLDNLLFNEKNELLQDFSNNAWALLNDKNPTHRLHRTKLSHSLNDSLVSCYFNWISCSSNNFTTYFESVYGNCFTFNSNSMNMSGQAYGLKIEMYAGFYEKLNLLNAYFNGMGAIVRIENGTVLSGNIYDGIKLGN